MLAAVTSGLQTALSWIGSFIEALVDTDGALNALLPLFAIGIAVSAILLGRFFAQVKSLEISGNLSILYGNQSGSLLVI